MKQFTSFEQRLRELFENQRFFCNPALDALIAETEHRCFGSRLLEEDELELVSAAGEDNNFQPDNLTNDLMCRIEDNRR